MGCRKGIKKYKRNPAEFRCKKCGAFAKKAKQVCKPKLTKLSKLEKAKKD